MATSSGTGLLYASPPRGVLLRKETGGGAHQTHARAARTMSDADASQVAEFCPMRLDDTSLLMQRQQAADNGNDARRVALDAEVRRRFGDTWLVYGVIRGEE
jgi:hypothetical protein